MKVNILNRLIIDPETIERVQSTSKEVSRKKREYSIFFLFKDNTHYSIYYGTADKKDSAAKNEIMSKMQQDMEKIYNQITPKK